MKIKKQDLLKSMNLIIDISGKALSDSTLKNVLFDTSDGLKLRSTNNELSLQCEVEADLKKEESFCVDSSKLMSVLKAMPDDDIEIKKNKSSINLISGKSKLKISSTDSGMFPLIKFDDYQNSFSIDSDEMIMIIDKALTSISDTESRLMFTGLYANIESNKINWTGANGQRISVFSTESSQNEAKMIIPKKSLSLIKKVLSGLKGKVEINYDDRSFAILTDKMKFKTQLVESEYADISKLTVLSGSHKTATIERQDLINSIAMLRTVSGEKDSAIKMSFQENKIMFSIYSENEGGESELECDYSGEEMSIGVNIRFLHESILTFDECEKVNINILNETSPIILTADNLPDFKSAMMPMRF